MDLWSYCIVESLIITIQPLVGNEKKKDYKNSYASLLYLLTKFIYLSF